MKLAKLIHNPGAGDEEHEKSTLVALIEGSGYECRYCSTKGEDWKRIEPEVDFIIAAGGDGTVHKVAKEMLDTTPPWGRRPIALLPLGTANNISKTLGVQLDVEEAVREWESGHVMKFDVGHVRGIEDPKEMLEGLGYGIFPRLMKEMKEKAPAADPEKQLRNTWKTLVKIIKGYKGKQCRIVADGVAYSGEYLMVEVMNICCVGPNLVLAPQAQVNDGWFELVLIPVADRAKLVTYVKNKLKDIDEPFSFEVIKAKSISLQWSGSYVHLDDELIKLKKDTEVKITMQPGLLEFIA